MMFDSNEEMAHQIRQARRQEWICRRCGDFNGAIRFQRFADSLEEGLTGTMPFWRGIERYDSFMVDEAQQLMVWFPDAGTPVGFTPQRAADLINELMSIYGWDSAIRAEDHITFYGSAPP